MIKLLGIAFALAIAHTPANNTDKIVRPFRRSYLVRMPNRGERRAVGDHERVR
jgi:hypothetical protein